MLLNVPAFRCWTIMSIIQLIFWLFQGMIFLEDRLLPFFNSSLGNEHILFKSEGH